MRIAEELRTFLHKNVSHNDNVQMYDDDARKVFRALKSFGERAVKGREISKHSFSLGINTFDDLVCAKMQLTGKHAVSVGYNVSKAFADHPNVERVEVIRTKNGAKVLIKIKAMQ